MTQRDKSVDSTSDVATAWALAAPSFELAERAYHNWLASSERIQSETLGFLSGRFEKLLATARELGSCTNPGDYLVVQAKYAEGALSDWLAESQKMADLFGEIAQNQASDAVEHGRESARRSNGHASRS
jgi:hypothetical protein